MTTYTHCRSPPSNLFCLFQKQIGGKLSEKLQRQRLRRQQVSPTLEDDYEERLDKQTVRKASKQLLASGELTETQERRFRLYYFKGLSLRQIADLENVHFTSVDESVKAATDKLKKFFRKT